MAGLVVVTAPAVEPVTVDEVIKHLRLDADTDEGEVESYIQASREWCENYTGRAFINRTLRLSIDGIDEVDIPLWEGWKTGPDISLRKRDILIPKPPLYSVTSVTTFDDADASTVFASTKYYVDKAREPGRVFLRNGETWPTALRVSNAVEIVYVAGYGATAGSVPASIVFAIKSLAAWLYEHRGEEPPEKLPANIALLLQQYRVLSLSDPFYNGYRAA